MLRITRLYIICVINLLLILVYSNRGYAWSGDTWGNITRQDITAIANTMIDSTWKPNNTINNYIDGILPRTVFNSNTVYTGEAYSQFNPQDNWNDFQNRVTNTSGGNTAYGNDCSGFVSIAWKLPSRKTTASFESELGNGYFYSLGNIGSGQNVALLQGDALNDNNNHIILFNRYVTSGLESMEQTPPKATRKIWSWSQLQSTYRPIRRNSITENGGYASVSAQSVSPSPVILGQNFNVSFTLKEVNGASKTFDQVAVAIVRSDNTNLFDVATYTNVTIPANGTFTKTATGLLYTTNPSGTYKAVVRGNIGGTWFDFDTTGSGVNPRSFSAVTQSVDTTPPAVSITQPPSWTVTETGTIDLSGTASDNVGVTQVSWSNNRGGSGICSGTSSWSATGILLQAGSNIITFTARDAAGNSAWSSITMTKDGTVSVSSLGYSTNPVVFDQNFNISFTLKEVSGAAKTFVQLAVAILKADGTNLYDVTTFSNISIPANGTWTQTVTTKMFSTNAPGTYKIIIRGKILNGNYYDLGVTGSGVNPISFSAIQAPVVDTTSPTISITTPVSGGVFSTGTSTLNIAGSASDNVGVTQVTWSNDRGGSGTCSGTSSWTTNGISLLGGTNIITVTARDAAGNTKATTLTVSLDGYASVSALSLSPSPVVLGQNFNTTFTLKEVRGAGKTFEQIAVAILKADGTNIFDAATYSNVTIPANSTWSQTSTNILLTSNPPGTYKAMVRGKIGGTWFDFDTTGSGVNPVSFSAVQAPVVDITAPTISVFTMPTTSNSLTVSVSSLVATDTVGVTGYLLSESGSQPLSNNPAWSASVPLSYKFASQGVKILYAFAKDGAGNISVPRSASVAITLIDLTSPTVTAFTLPTTASNLAVPVSSLTATDTVGVTGYLLSETSNQPQANDPDWSVAVPTSHSFATQGVKTLYAFAKDAAGNISVPLSAIVTITLADRSAPVVTNFKIPANSTSLTVPITTLVTTDSVGVTGYLLSESGSQPQSNVQGWSANLPTQYVFISQGSKTLYVFAKDAAGNISAPLSANVTISLADTTAPVVSTFTIPTTSTVLTVSISSFSATDTVGVTGYYLSETSTAPLQNDSHWTTTPTSSFTFTSAGSKTLYAFAKDAAGNISTPVSDTVTITLADTSAPTVTVFTMPTTATSLIVPVTKFTANDNSAVTGYILKELATAPQPNISGWTSTAPSAYTFNTAGSLTLYAFAKDAAGNVSVPISASIRITLSDTTAPTVTTFVVPATSNSLTVPITTFTATDNVAVTGYQLSEVSTAPSLTAQNWTSTPQVSYTFSTTGSKILYAFAKDAAGIISPPASDSVIITLSAIAGDCGISDGQVFTVIPTTNLCNIGTATAVTGTGPWSWSCGGTNGGIEASCSASSTTSSITQFIVTPATGSGFTIVPSTPQTVNRNAATSFNVTPAPGFGVASVSGCGGSFSGSTYTTGPITANCTISVTSVARNANSGDAAQPPTISDALKVLQSVVGITPLTVTEKIRYDVAPLSANGTPLGNGVLDAADVIAILRRSIGIGSW